MPAGTEQYIKLYQRFLSDYADFGVQYFIVNAIIFRIQYSLFLSYKNSSFSKTYMLRISLKSLVK